MAMLQVMYTVTLQYRKNVTMLKKLPVYSKNRGNGGSVHGHAEG